MKKRRIKIQCKCHSCGKIWMDSKQWIFCSACIANGSADKWKNDFLEVPK